MKTTVHFRLKDEPTNPNDEIVNNAKNTEYVARLFTTFTAEFEGVDVDSILSDVLDAGAQIQKQFIRLQLLEERYTTDILPIDIFITATVFGMELEQQTTIDEQRFNELKEDKEPEQDVNFESLVNDIEQTIPILQSLKIDDSRANAQRNHAVAWVYHILEKHFKVPVPDDYKPVSISDTLGRVTKE